MLELQKIEISFNFKDYHFDCRNDELNDFFYNKSKGFMKESYSQIYILKEKGGYNIIGYFAISCCHIEFSKELLFIEKKARYIPGLLIGQLAIDKQFQNKNFGKDLLKMAVIIGLRISKKVGCRLIVIDASARLRVINFYKKYNFKFAKKSLGEKIIKELEKNNETKYSTAKMIFDLNDLNI